MIDEKDVQALLDKEESDIKKSQSILLGLLKSLNYEKINAFQEEVKRKCNKIEAYKIVLGLKK